MRRAPTRPEPRSSCGAGGSSSPLLVFSLMKGIFHEYYTVALTPAIAALVGIGAHLVWQHRQSFLARLVGAAAILVTALWSSALLSRAPGWNVWLRPVITVGAVITAGAMLLGPRVAGGRSSRPRRSVAWSSRSWDRLHGRCRPLQHRTRARSSPLGPACSVVESASAACRSPGAIAPPGVPPAASREAALDRRRDRCLEPEPSDQPPTARCSAEASVAPPLEAC